MLLKKADDKSKRLALLQDLQKSPMLDARQKAWLGDELDRVRKGVEGENESAFILDQYFKDGKNHVLLHDLRFVVDGDVAQIDHMVINRFFNIYLIETKNYGGSVSINAHGEFTMQYGSNRFGVQSPIEQSLRHERVLRKLLERLEITNRIGSGFEFFHVVMFHPKAIITRPSVKEFDTSNVIKADQFPTWHQKFVDNEIGVGDVLKGMMNMRSLELIRESAEKLVRQHRPDNPLALPEFMQPKVSTPAAVAQSRAKAPAPAEVIQPIQTQQTDARTKKLICMHCNSKISFAEGKFCWNNEKRFGGGQYCREHQSLF